MVSRKNSQTGQRFWGCEDFPECRGTRNTDGEAPEEARRPTRPPGSRTFHQHSGPGQQLRDRRTTAFNSRSRLGFDSYEEEE